MQLVEQHCIKKSHPGYAAIDAAAFASKNLYNQATYHFRQAYIHEGIWLSYAEVFHRIKRLDCYQALPRKVSNSILIAVDKHWRAYRRGLKEWLAHPEKFTGKLVPSGLPLAIATKVAWERIDCVRIVPRGSYYVAEVVYTVAEQQAAVDQSVVAAIDLGVNVLAAITSTKADFARRVNAYLHTASRRIIDLLVEKGIGTLVIGLNRLWKQGVELGKRANQQFVQIPHSRFIQMLAYKAQLVGMRVIIREESYTSQASFLDLDAIPTYDPTRKEKPRFSGRREKRGLYRAKDGRRIQADVNAAYNTLRKEFPNAFSDSQTRAGQEIVAPAVVPCRLVDKRREERDSSVSTSRLDKN